MFASYAQFGVDAEDENLGRFIMAYEFDPLFVETNYCGKSIRTTSDDFTTKLDRTCIVAKAMYSVACLE